MIMTRHFCIAVNQAKTILGHKASHLEVCERIQSILHLVLNVLQVDKGKQDLLVLDLQIILAGVQKQGNLVKNSFLYKPFKIFVAFNPV